MTVVNDTSEHMGRSHNEVGGGRREEMCDVMIYTTVWLVVVQLAAHTARSAVSDTL